MVSSGSMISKAAAARCNTSSCWETNGSSCDPELVSAPGLVSCPWLFCPAVSMFSSSEGNKERASSSVSTSEYPRGREERPPSLSGGLQSLAFWLSWLFSHGKCFYMTFFIKNKKRRR